MTRTTTMSVVAIAIAACAAPPRPRPPLPPAGSTRDDGDGLLAELSQPPQRRPAEHRHEVAPAPAPEPRRRDATRYGSYQFNPSVTPRPAPQPYAAPYRPGSIERAGAIIGQLSWRGAPPIDPAPAGCAIPPARTGAAARAIVHLEPVASGRALLNKSGSAPIDGMQLGGVIELGACGLVPRVQLAAPIGAQLTLANRSPVARALTLRWLARPDGPVEVGLAPGGSHDLLLDQAGALAVARQGEAPSAWIVVAGHPYHAVTDERGEFRLDDVPAGTYDLVAWWPPSAIARLRVSVRAGRATHVVARIAPR